MDIWFQIIGVIIYFNFGQVAAANYFLINIQLRLKYFLLILKLIGVNFKHLRVKLDQNIAFLHKITLRNVYRFYCASGVGFDHIEISDRLNVAACSYNHINLRNASPDYRADKQRKYPNNYNRPSFMGGSLDYFEQRWHKVVFKFSVTSFAVFQDIFCQRIVHQYHLFSADYIDENIIPFAPSYSHEYRIPQDYPYPLMWTICKQ